MSDRGAILDQLKQIMEDDTEVDVEKLSESASIREDLGLDSVDLVGVVMKIEGVYRIRLTHQDLQGVTTVNDMIDLIISKQATQAPPA